jgi:3-methyl-2-oxobutanoate hydroxymethyltransferase
MTRKKVTTTSLLEKKRRGEKIVVATAYDATMATLLDEGGVDVLMVGDSLGMVIQGHDNTLSVTLDEMIYHSRTVARIRPRAHIVCDLPFLSYQVSAEQALLAGGRLLKEGGAESVKLEGGRHLAASVRSMVRAGIPVMGHIGLTPQSVHQLGGFRVQGRTEAAARELVADAIALEEAGAYSLVLEGVPTSVAERVTEAVSIPTIGIGAGPKTDGQVLVSYDFLGMYRGLSPKFVKRFAELGTAIVEATERFGEEVRGGEFPSDEHGFSMLEGQGLSESGGKT